MRGKTSKGTMPNVIHLQNAPTFVRFRLACHKRATSESG
jgi:hypothetical protein